MPEIISPSLRERLVGIAASALLAVILAMLQNILAAHGVDCAPTASPTTAGTLGILVKSAHDYFC